MKVVLSYGGHFWLNEEQKKLYLELRGPRKFKRHEPKLVQVVKLIPGHLRIVEIPDHANYQIVRALPDGTEWWTRWEGPVEESSRFELWDVHSEHIYVDL